MNVIRKLFLSDDLSKLLDILNSNLFGLVFELNLVDFIEQVVKTTSDVFQVTFAVLAISRVSVVIVGASVPWAV